MHFIIVAFFCLALSSAYVNAEENDFDTILDEIVYSLTVSPQKSTILIDDMLSRWSALSAEQKSRVKVYQAILKTYDAEYQASIQLLREAEQLNSSDVSLNQISQYLATNYIALKNYPAALELMEKNLERISEISDVSIKVASYVRLANLAMELSAYQDMKAYAVEAMVLSQNLDTKQHCFAQLFVAVADLKQQEYEKAKNAFQRSKVFCEGNQFPLIGLMSRTGLALVAIETEEFKGSRKLLEHVLKGYQEFNFQTEINHVNALLSQTYLGLGDYAQAEEFANKVMGLSDEPSHINYKAIASRVLSQLYLESEQFELAYDYLESHQQYNTLILDDTKAKANAYQMAKFKHQEQAREIALLNQERQLMQTQKELDQSDQTNSLMLVTMLIGSIFFLSLFLLSSHRQKIRYRKLALTDRLTGVYNRGAGQDFAENEFIQISMRNANFSVVLFDLDFFKTLNDRFGHATGDWALKHVVAVVKPLIRDSDIFCRMGGEEFALFLPYSNQRAAIEIAERCKTAIENIDTKYSGHTFTINASFGISSNIEEDLSLDPILKRADIALYKSKGSGRNCVTVYSEELEHKDPLNGLDNGLKFS
ncbi:GGDEF domain-containing protein [Shewanella sairae]|uniref:diguanylate cyclase n=1 Tax=Shewanella sairae TaxID=190310 RepID=A0ABQ4PQF8_9GAMM|nr:GGDEF domain-containing protein [Shewanella sairae]MCL1129324.1 diguanylate cyclase [Shewanella sairae]GIU51166.1 GGDEF domain-containing protein [Shewanella sairae]